MFKKGGDAGRFFTLPYVPLNFHLIQCALEFSTGPMCFRIFTWTSVPQAEVFILKVASID